MLGQGTMPHFSRLMTKMKVDKIFFAVFISHACFPLHASEPELKKPENWELGRNE